jgi:hypothetical protein
VRLTAAPPPVTLPPGVWLDELYDLPSTEAAASALPPDYAR